MSTHVHELALLDDAIRLATSSVERNRSHLRIRAATQTPEAVAAFFVKGWKTIPAIRLLAESGYGQDAMILLRSLTNLAIDMAYICHEHTDERLHHWVSAARVARRKLAKDLRQPLADEEGTDGCPVEQAANQWNGRGIRQRAEGAHVENLHMFMYRLGSTFDHTDAWTMSDFVSVRDGQITMDRAEPSPQYIAPALTGAVLCLGVTLGCLSRFFEFEHLEELQRLNTLIETIPV
jgi:hypothetical protein